MISRTTLILSTLAFCTLASIQDTNAACNGGVCSMKEAQAPKIQNRQNKVAAIKTVKRGCSRCKKAKRVKRNTRRTITTVTKVAAVTGCKNGMCALRHK